MTAKTGEISELRYDQDTKYFRNPPNFGLYRIRYFGKNYKSFRKSKLGRLHSVFPSDSIAKETGLSEQRLGHKSIFRPCAEISLIVLKSYTGFSDRQPVEHLNGTYTIRYSAEL